ncbi:MAG: FecR family protein [Spirochaetales bacterium]|nr:FecR family protein [Spirochaetales bacterium]
MTDNRDSRFKRTFFTLLCLLTAAVSLPAESSAEIVYAEGAGFSLVRNGESRYYDIYEGEADGLALRGGDLILTEDETWIELQLSGSGTIIKIAENTTFTLKTLQDEGGTFEVAYGRVRARVEKLTADTPFWIEGSDTVAGVRGTDFGYDLFYDPAEPSKKNVSVYCFEGRVEVVRRLEVEEGEAYEAKSDFATGKEKTSTVMLGKNEMVSIDSETRTEELKKSRIEPEIKEFWELNEFIYEPEPADDIQQSAFQNFHNDKKELQQGALISATTGALIAGVGAAAYYALDAPQTGVGLMAVGSSVIAAGGYFLIRSFLIE